MNAARRALCGLLLGLCLAAASHAAAPSVRVEVQPQGPVLVGQQVTIDVTVVAPNFFTSAAPFPPLDVPGAIVTLPDERATLGVETVAGETYATVQKRYLFTAQQPGDFNLPAVQIEFSYAGDDSKPLQANLRLPATRLSARLPAGASATGAALPVARLMIRQTFDRPTDSLKAGDALVRTIDVRAEQTQAMMIPPPRFEAPAGVRMYLADPVLRDEGGNGRRIDRATYVFEKAGRFILPAIELRWLDPATRKPASAQAPALTLRVAAAGSTGEGIATEGVRKPVDWLRWGCAAAFVLLAIATLWLLRARGPRWRAQWQAWRGELAVSDAAMFRHLLALCAHNDARAAHGALLAWCARHAQAAPRAWAARFDDSGLGAQIDALERHLYRAASAPGSAWQGAGLAAALRAAHRQWQRQTPRSFAQRRAQALGPLNPLGKIKA